MRSLLRVRSWFEMRSTFARAAEWIERDGACAFATLVAVHDLTPDSLGTTQAVSARGEVAGTIGAGRYEAEVLAACAAALADGRSRALEIELAAGDELFPCSGSGGSLCVVAWRASRDARGELVKAAIGNERAEFAVEYELYGQPATYRLGVELKRRLVVVGATVLADDLAALAARLDWTTVVVDPRAAFATAQRLPNAGAIDVRSPEEALHDLLTGETPVVIVSHDPKLDLPALRFALASPAPYVGILGNRRTQRERRDALAVDGFDHHTLSRIRGPAGLDLGGSSGGETALSILAEIVSVLHEREGGPLCLRDGSIHAAP